MNQEQIKKAADTLAWVARETESLSASEVRVQMTMVLQLARTYLVEYQLHVAEGEPHDVALAQTAEEVASGCEAVVKHRRPLK
jgi:hypothetical protein